MMQARETRLAGLRAKQKQRTAKGETAKTPQTGADGKIHPMAIFDAIKAHADPDHIAIADGGDLLSFARIGLEASTYMDAGAFGCLGVGVPFAVAASLAFPGRQVISVNGDGAFGLNAMEIDTAVRHGATPVWIVSNNAAWNIERFDQDTNYGGRVVGTTLQHADYAAMARALGAHGERVEDPADLPAANRTRPRKRTCTGGRGDVSGRGVVRRQKGLGFVPDYQALTAWDDAERKRRGETDTAAGVKERDSFTSIRKVTPMHPQTVPHTVFNVRVRNDALGGANPFEWAQLTSADVFAGCKVVLFAVPGAFTPACSESHLPGYEGLHDDLIAAGADKVVCLSVNDPFVLFQWARAHDIAKVMMLPDGNGDFSRLMGMLVQRTTTGMGMSQLATPCRRGRPHPPDVRRARPCRQSARCPGRVSAAATMLEYLRSGAV